MATPFQPEHFGQYLLLAHLGRGGMADVYKARVEGVAGFARNVVVKRILKVHTEEPHFVEMFINEAKIAARLAHPNIVQVYELGEVAGELFMALEYVRGQDLLRIMRSAASRGEPAPPPRVAAYIVREVARALAHAHEHTDETGAPRPIIHRDVSPQNVMLSYDGQVKLVDFGIAKAVTAFHEGTRTGSLKGKFGYMAPEQIDTGVCTPQTDIFSAGVVLHEILTGRRLFKGQTDYDTMNRVKVAPLLPPSQANPAIVKELDRIAMTALERDPGKRYQRAAQLGRDLDAYLQSERFSPDEVMTWLLRAVPKEEREDATESQAVPVASGTPSRFRSGVPTPGRSLARLPVAGIAGSPLSQDGSLGSLSSARGAHSSSAPQAVGISAASHSIPPAAPVYPQQRQGGSRVLLLATSVAAMFLISLGSVFLILRPPKVPPSPIVTPGAPAPPAEKAPAREQARPLSLRLDSDPSGAVVYAGPRRLGQTPLSVELRGESLDIVLSYGGRPDLAYTLRPSDGESLTLRLPAPDPPDRRTRRIRRPRQPAEVAPPPEEAPQPPPPRAPIKVRPVDEDEPPHQGEKPVD